MHDQNRDPSNPPDADLTALPDSELVSRIDELVAEEHQLERGHASEDGLSQDQARRLRHLEVQLDQAWDLLRQRRARRHAGLDPAGAQQRDPEVVEHYQQ